MTKGKRMYKEERNGHLPFCSSYTISYASTSHPVLALITHESGPNTIMSSRANSHKDRLHMGWSEGGAGELNSSYRQKG